MKTLSWTVRAAFAASLFGALLSGSPSAHAAMVNGSFETGDLTGWTANPGTGSVSALLNSQASDGTVYNPTQGNFLASLFAGDTGVYTTLSQTFTVGAGGAVLSGNVAFLAHDFLPNNDDGYVKLNNLVLFSTDVATVGDFGATAWTQLFAGLSAGVYTLELGVRNVGDNQLPSEILADDFSVTATPLPAALPLFVTGAGVLGAFGWRRKRKAADQAIA
jgi:hypothetical protein